MGVPAEIRAVPRPKNTVVLPSTTGRYSVRARDGCRYEVDENGKKRRIPVEGSIVGHIVNGIYIAIEDEIPPAGQEGEVDLKDWANVYLCDLLNKDIYDDLKTLYNTTEATQLYVMAILRGTYSDISDHLLQRQYEETFLTELLPPVNLEKSHVSEFLRNVGRSCGRITEFSRRRVNALDPDETVVIDSSLQVDNSTVNSLSAASRKSRATRSRHVVIMYAYSAERREPLCSQIYPGNMVDKRIVKSFIDTIDLQSGLVVADKGFVLGSMRDALQGRPGVHFVIPLERDDTLIDRYDMYAFEGRLKGDRGILFKKSEARAEDGSLLWLYSFRDPVKAMEQEMLYMAQHQEDFDPTDYDLLKREFGVVVFASDSDLECGRVYSIYSDRWLIEMFFKFRKGGFMEIGDTREHSDYTTIASEFVNSLASICSARVFNYLESRGVLDDRTFGEASTLLERLKMTRISDGEWNVRRIAKKDAEVVEKLGLVRRPIIPAEKRGRGRPKGSKDSKPRKKRESSQTSQSS